MNERQRIEERLHRLSDPFSDPDEKRAVQQRYVQYFAPGLPVLDVGCGRGEFLEALGRAGIRGVGIDRARPDARVPDDGELVQGDAIEALAALASAKRTFGGAMLSHVIEHFAPERALALLDALYAVVQPGGRLVVATPNTRNLVSITEFFWLDPTHVRPYPRALVERLAVDAGWHVLESYEDPATVPRRPAWKRMLARVRSALSGADRSSPLDSVVVLEKR